MCDFVIPNNTEADQQRGPHFMVSYDPILDTYYARDLAVGYGIYVKLDYTLALNTQKIINIGESHIAIFILPSTPYPKLCLRVFCGNTVSELMFFEAQEFHINQVAIGRSKDCNVFVDDNMLSKKQATIFYSQRKG